MFPRTRPCEQAKDAKPIHDYLILSLQGILKLQKINLYRLMHLFRSLGLLRCFAQGNLKRQPS